MTYVSSRPLETMALAISRISKSQIALSALTLFPSFLRLCGQWRQRAVERQYLSELDDHVLADYGLTRQDVIDEAAKPFWRPLDPGSRKS